MPPPFELARAYFQLCRDVGHSHQALRMGAGPHFLFRRRASAHRRMACCLRGNIYPGHSVANQALSFRRKAIGDLEVHLQLTGPAHLYYPRCRPRLLRAHAVLSHSPTSSDAMGAPPSARVDPRSDDIFPSAGSCCLKTSHAWQSRYL